MPKTWGDQLKFNVSRKRKPKPGRIGSDDWTQRRAHKVFAVYNSNYTTEGTRLHEWDRPWTVHGPNGEFKQFRTHNKAIAYATKKACK